MSGGVSRGFADLHARSGFSFGFGVATPEELVAAGRCGGADENTVFSAHGLGRALRHPPLSGGGRVSLP